MQAINELNQLNHCRITSCSRLYQSAPIGVAGQPDYCNAVVALKTCLLPEVLLDALQSLENDHQRIRKERWGARTLDLDILLYGSAVIHSSRLIIPHPEMHLRNFVIYPLADINPSLCLPSGQRISELCHQLGDDGLRVIGSIDGAC